MEMQRTYCYATGLLRYYSNTAKGLTCHNINSLLDILHLFQAYHCIHF
jgi:hypothetical protein